MGLKKMPRRPVYDITGPAGNAFAVMGQAKAWAEDLGLDPEEVLADMKAPGNYEGLIIGLNKHFGEYVDIIVPESMEHLIDAA